ncbi:hypothetical protein [Allobranchiibius sp. CTAmp26]|uniref:hypothetical protein n=1 Tax=Allobranchiibius sp. CTAmp26 TaxID=2815214 RepID=UPI001AA15406|nr:hypothetical protein [Allobranchiibius sp. CTAmp26]MBO1755765.1 hypothetical protein [Allobranchiibius sp. CTAmp26]
MNQTLAQTVAVHADTYYYLIWDRNPRTTSQPATATQGVSQDRWDKLPSFAAQAAKKGIKVVVYLVPPSESVESTYRPFGWNYEKWFRSIGTVAVTHPAIVGIAMDDISSNFAEAGSPPGKFTLSTLMQMRDAARSTAPWMRFYALVYGQDVIGATRVLPSFRAAVDGIIYAFAGPGQIRHARQNTTDAQGLASTTARIRAVTGCAGLSQCWQADFKPAARTSVTKSVHASTSLLPARASRRLSIALADDRSGSDGTTYSVKLTLNGKAITTSRQTRKDGASVFTASVPASSGSNRVTLGLDITKSAVGRALAVFVDSVDLASGGGVTHLLQGSGTSWSFATAPGAQWSVVKPLQLITMFYCSRFGIEADTPGAADVGYVNQLIPQLRQVVQQHLADGVVAYRLNVTGTRHSLYEGDTNNFNVVRALYTGLASASTS